MDKTDYPEVKACKVWKHRGATLSLVKQESKSTNHYCGYVRFPKRFTIEQGCGGLLTYVPAHGGLTYAREGADGSMVYGFDCAHWLDDDDPNLRDEEWLTKHCEDITWWLLTIPEYEAQYLTSATNGDRCAVIEMYTNAINAGDRPMSTAIMLNLMSGDL